MDMIILYKISYKLPDVLIVLCFLALHTTGPNSVWHHQSGFQGRSASGALGLIAIPPGR
jgi:hypothetical protein